MNVEQLILVLMIIFGIAFIVIITLLIIFLRRQALRKNVMVWLITPDMRKERHLKTPDSENNIIIGQEAYKYEEKATIKTRWNKEIYYFKGCKEPIYFSIGNHKIEITASNYKQAIKNNLIAQVFGGGLLSPQGILLIIILILIVGLGILIMLKGNNGLTPEVLETTLRSVLLGV